MESFPIVFAKLKPMFEDLLKNPTIDNLIEFNQQIKCIDGNVLQYVQEFFLQRMVLLIDQITGENKNEVQWHLIEGVKMLLEKVKLKKSIAFQTCIFVLVKQVYNSKTHEVRKELSEEIKLSVLQSISAAGRNLPTDVVEEVYVKNNVHLISQVIYVCTEMLVKETYRKIKYAALDCILSIMQIHDATDFEDIIMRCQIAELLFIILPKLLASICSVINGDDKIGFTTMAMSIKTLERILCLIFEDYRRDNFEDNPFDKFSEFRVDAKKETSILVLNKNNKNEYFANTTRSKEWLLEADKKISVTVISSIVHLRGNRQNEVRLEYAKLCCNLTLKCEKYLPLSVPTLLESAIALTQDDNPKIRKLCCSTLQKMSSNVDFLKHNFDEYFNHQLLRMPRILYRGEDNAQISALLLVKGYLHFFSVQQMRMILSNEEVLENLMTMLIISSEFKNGNELLRREYLTPMQKDDQVYQHKWLAFKNTKSDKSRQIIEDILRCFHRDEECNQILINYILDDIYRSKFNCNECIFLLGQLITDSNRATNYVILEEMLQPYHWNLDVDSNEEICNQKFNILHICLTLKCLGNLAEKIGTEFKWHVYDSLHFIVEMAGSDVNCIHEQAELTLEALSKSLNFANISDFLSNNLDYLSQFISKSIKRRENFKEGINVLQSVLHYTVHDTSSILEDTISPILIDIIQNINDRTNAKICLKVLHIFIVALRKKMAIHIEKKPKVRNTYEELIKFIYEHEPVEKIENTAENEQNNNDADDIQVDLPEHVKIIDKILTICSRYLASSNQSMKIISLETIECGIHLLKDHENILLPLVHNIWYTFSERFNENDPLIVTRAFDLFITLARLAKDFIRMDAIRDILPKINNFLDKTFGACKSEIQVTRLQAKILQNYGKLIISIQLQEKELSKIFEVVGKYLSSENAQIKCAATEFFDDLRFYDPTVVILVCQDVY